MANESFQSVVEIVPLEGNYETISLRGSALPLQGVEYPTEQAVHATRYVGNPEKTLTVGGPDFPAGPWTGRWMDADLGEGGARALVLRFEALAKRAVPIEVRWGGRQLANSEDPAIVRRGLIRRFAPKYHTLWNIEWTCEFEWKGEATQTQPPILSKAFSPSDDFAAFSDMLNQAQEQSQSWKDVYWNIIGLGAGALLTISDALDDAQDAVADILIMVDAAAELTAANADLPSDVADRVRGMADQAVLVCQDVRAACDAVCGLWPGSKLLHPADLAQSTGRELALQAKRAKLALFPTDDPLARLDGQNAQFDLVLSWDLLADQAAMASAQLASRQVPDIIAIVRPPAGSDLRDLAAKPEIYGDPDLWYLIAAYNDLPSSEVPAGPDGVSDDGGPPIYVPRRSDYATPLLSSAGDGV